jgi:prophage regulatory protein
MTYRYPKLDTYVRLRAIVGDARTGKPGILPMAASTWWAGVAAGRYPKPVKLGPRITAWRLADVLAVAAGSED